MQKINKIVLLPFNIKIYERLWDMEIIDKKIFNREGKYYKDSRIYITDKDYGELVLYINTEKKEKFEPREVKKYRKILTIIRNIFYQFQVDFCLQFQKYCNDNEISKGLHIYMPTSYHKAFNDYSFCDWMIFFGINEELMKLNKIKYDFLTNYYAIRLSKEMFLQDKKDNKGF